MTPATEFRTFFEVEVGVIYGGPTDGTWLVFPDGKLTRVNARAYANLDDALAAHVAVWRKKNHPEAARKQAERDLFEEIRTEADSEIVTDECGAVGKYGARCYRQQGHQFLATTHARAHIGPVREGGPDAKFIDDGVEQMEIWTAEKLPEVFH